MAWTDQQKRAIYERGSNIIVSAGAGSGKTAVLSERILDYCLKGNDIRRVLVLTFTSAAAMEMKERIRKKLIDNKLDEQASLIDSAAITTFDAYSLSLVKKYYYKLGLESNIGVIDPTLLMVKQKQILEEMFNEKYELKDEMFFGLLKKYSTQDDKKVKSMILSLVKEIDLLVDESEFYSSYEEKYFSNDSVNKIVSDYEKLCVSKLKDLVDSLTSMQELSALDNACVKIYDAITGILNDLSGINSYEDAVIVIRNLVLPRMSPKVPTFVKEARQKVAGILKELKEKVFGKYLFTCDMKDEIFSLKDDVLYILSLCKELQDRLFNYKKSIMSFSYNDIAKMAISLVKDFPDVNREIASNLNEILIDEYQDTSDIQETFISYISNNNCYMVGDIKQSIYRFRNANPYLFKNKYDKYALEDGGKKIDLTFNFRSRKEVLANINDIFSYLMTNECGDANYLLDHKMIYGLKAYENIKQDYDFNMEVLGYESSLEYDDVLVEAFICGRKILELVNDKKPLCLKGQEFKEVKYSDIAILIDKTASFKTFKKVFEYLGIPLSIEADMDLTQSILPKLFSNVLVILNAIKTNNYDVSYKHALASVARSFLVELSDEDIYLMLKTEENELIDKFKELAYDSVDKSYQELFFMICDFFDIYAKLPKIGDVDNSLVVLEYIHNLFKTIGDAAFGLEEVSVFFDMVFEDSGIDLKYKLVNNSSNSVRIMTIHKSKGLEFPHCFFPMLSSGFNMMDLRQSTGLSKKYGVFIPYSDEGNSDTIIKSLVTEEVRKADISEKIRLLYVALTRAREKFYLISNDKEYSDKQLYSNNYGCFNHMVRALSFIDGYKTKIDIDSLGLTLNLKPVASKLDGIKEQRLYQDSYFTSTLLHKTRISKEIKELTSESLKRAIELGLEFHECLEVLDFNNIDVDGLPVSNYIKSTLKKLLNHEVFGNISNAKTYHEHEFYFENEKESYHGIIDLLVEYDDHIDIIDYKLSNTDSVEYIKQLSIYRNYVLSIKEKPVNCYLLSILKQEIKKIDI